MGTKSKKIVKLNGMEMCDEIRVEIEAINSETAETQKRRRAELSEYRLKGEVLEGKVLNGETGAYWWDVFPSSEEDLQFYDFIKEKFPEYLI